MKMNKMKALLSFAFAATLTAGAGVAALNVSPAKSASAETTHTEAIFMENGASVRYSDPSGIRFTAYVKDDGDLSDNAVGIKVKVNGVEKDFSKAAAGSEWKWAESDVAGYQKFNVAIYDIPEANYTTEMTAQAYVDDNVSAEIVTRSIANVANAALAKNEMMEAIGGTTLNTTKVSALDGYTPATTALESVDANSITYANDAFTWGAVENAKGYFVSYGGEVVHVLGETSVSVSAFSEASDATDVSVIAYGDGATTTYSEVVSNTVMTVDLTLANFTDANNGTISNVDGYGWGSGKTATYRTAPFYEEGTAKAGIYMDRYHADGSSTKLAAFKVNLPKGLDLTKDGIAIRVNIYDKSGSLTLDKFTLLSKDGQATWQNKTSADFPGVTATYQELIEVKISSADLQAMGYGSGNTTLYFGCWTTNEVAKHLSTGIWFQLDDISYYADTNLTLANFTDANNGTLSNVSGYGYTNYRENLSYVDGTAKAGFYMDRYHADGSSTKLAAFKVTLPKGLDLTKDGIVIRVNIYDKSGSLTLDKFTLLSKDGQKTWQNKTSADFPGATATYQEWMEVKISSAQLQAMGYATGDTTLYFGFWTTSGVAKHLSYGIWFQLDEISYYKEGES